ncbi:MAG: GNAT family N-acetyltransferase [Lachnospiraceae bacterium]|nr:GNAT family N-acetyltransferase [Lachnospiraceae bacterium]
MTKDELCKEQEIFAENDKIILERLSVKYKNEYIDLICEVSQIQKTYDTEEDRDIILKYSLESEDLILCIINKENNMLIGQIMLKNLSNDEPEIGIDISREYRRQGYGFQAISLFIEQLKSIGLIEVCTVRIYLDNIPSQNLFKKFNICEVEKEDSEFIVAMDTIKEVLGEETYKMAQENYAEQFSAENKRKIIKYHMFI